MTNKPAYANHWIEIQTITGWITMKISHFMGTLRAFDHSKLDDHSEFVYSSLTVYKRAKIKYVIDDGSGGVFFLSRRQSNEMVNKVDEVKEIYNNKQ